MIAPRFVPRTYDDWKTTDTSLDDAEPETEQDEPEYEYQDREDE